MTMPDDPSSPSGTFYRAMYEAYMQAQEAGFTAAQAFDLTLRGIDLGWFDQWCPWDAPRAD